MMNAIFPETLGLFTDAIKAVTESTLEINNETIKSFHPSSLVHRASALYRLRRYDDSIRDSTSAIRLNHNFGEAYFVRAKAKTHKSCAEQIEIPDIIIDLSNAIRLMPNNIEPHLYLGTWYCYKKSYELAKKKFAHAQQMNKDEPLIYYHLAAIASEQEDYDSAVGHYRTAISYKAKTCHAESLHNLGSLFMQIGKLKDAQENLEASLEIDPSSGMTYFVLAQVYMHQGELVKALAAIEAALCISPHNLFADQIKLSILSKMGEMKEATEIANRMSKAAISAQYPFVQPLINSFPTTFGEDAQQKSYWNDYKFFPEPEQDKCQK